MNRIMVMGVSAGVGKSTFARKLGEALQLDVYHLDTIFWKPNWVETPLEEFRAKQKEIVKKDQWIIDGNYSNSYDIREQHADTIIYLELPLLVCLYRVLKRRIVHSGKTRPDMREGCEEKIDFKFLKFIITTYHRRKKMMRTRFKEFQNSKRVVIVLQGREEIKQFLKEYERGGRGTM
ncbi:DNA topology modulation protein [Evansella tamaricis]|uniref:DNA topology modulation protein n=1 Tax=Evansella tamaricis TaxID=2069301 RepID=A0ABS6JA40_9BACI|nr:DNA topology modulation protein [Evansella tamaricis]MBU9710549.1 DNA topology modulation protein [Evansella tamaricis]